MQGLRVAKDMDNDKLAVFGDSKLIVNQVKDIYYTNQLRFRQYKNYLWDLVDNFILAFNISFIPRDANQREDSLALVVSTFRPLIGQSVKYEVEVRHKTTIPFYFKHW